MGLRPSTQQERSLAARSMLAVERDAVQFHAMIDQAKAQLLGDAALQNFELLIDELYHVAGLDVDQMIVMGFCGGFVARAAVTEIMPFQDPGFLEQPDGPINGRDRNAAVDRGGAGMERLHVRMIFRFREDTCDHPPLLRNAETFLGAQRFDIDSASHPGWIRVETRSSQWAVMETDLRGLH